MDPSVGIENAANQIADLANRYPGKKVRILGYSMGGVIGILASSRMQSTDVRVAAMSTAVPRAGGLNTALRASGDVLAAALRVRSVDRETDWLEYYRTLLFGHVGLKGPALADQIDALAAAKKETIVLPSPTQADAHSLNLRGWSLPKGTKVGPARVRFFVGLADPVFTTAQTHRFSRHLGGVRILGIPVRGICCS
jgi:pimeloyl-ACP methyl ester carboxylesterase